MLYKPTSSRLRHLALLLFLIASVTRLTARDFTYQGITYTVLSEEDKTVETKAGSGSGNYSGSNPQGDIVLPEIVSDGTNQYTLIKIGTYSFYKCSEIKSIIIPNSVITIGHAAFSNSSIEDVVMSNSVTEIGHSVFFKCYKLKNITLSNQIKSIGFSAFQSCTSLEEIILPPEITKIESNTFNSCMSLKHITIPNKVIEIQNDAFYFCNDLSSIILGTSIKKIDDTSFKSNEISIFRKMAVPEGVTIPKINGCQIIKYNPQESKIADGFIYSSDNKSIIFAPTVISGSYTINESTEYIGNCAFSLCKEITTITLPENILQIGNNAFYECSSLTSVTIPNSVTTIGEKTFANNKKLNVVKIMGSPTIDYRAFSGDIIDRLYFYKSVVLENGALGGLDVKSNIYCKYNDLTYIKSLFYGNVYPYDIPILPVISDTFQGGIKLKPEVNPHFEGDAANLTFIGEVYDANNNKITSSNISFTEPTFIKGLLPKTKYTIKYLLKNSNGDILGETSETFTTKDFAVNLEAQTTQNTAKLTLTTEPDESIDISRIILNIKKGTDDEGTDYTYSGESITLKDLSINSPYSVKVNIYGQKNEQQEEKLIKTSDFSFTTKDISVKLNTQTTQTTAKLSLTTDQDEWVNISKTIVNINPYKYSGEGTDYTYSGKAITIKDLGTGLTYYVKVKLYEKINGQQEENLIKTSEFSFNTKNIYVTLSKADVGPTAVKLKAVVDAGDAKIKEAYWEGGETNPEIELTGMQPGSSNTFKFFAYPEKGSVSSASITVETPALELTMLDPKSVSPTSAILAAQTNISDNEPNVGFQWKKYDAPASLKPSEGYGAVYDGILEGQLKNLQSTSYYNARAFYKDGKNNYYYSDWVTFDPSDFSYFQPTAHTYPVEKITTAYVSIKGYVMAGSEPILSQGFQYWVNGSANKMQAFAPSADKIMTITGTGQVMTANLTDLQSNTEYTVRTFVQTESGTVYGEEQIFTTLENMSVSEISADKGEVEIVGYYDLMGRRYDRPRKGMNIVVYSDGTTRKVIER